MDPGQCTKPQVQSLCMQTCGLCPCQNYEANVNCENWAKEGRCNDPEGDIQAICRYSCGLCPDAV